MKNNPKRNQTAKKKKALVNSKNKIKIEWEKTLEISGPLGFSPLLG